MNILYFVSSYLESIQKTGVHRVQICLLQALQQIDGINVVPVTWCDSSGCLKPVTTLEAIELGYDSSKFFPLSGHPNLDFILLLKEYPDSVFLNPEIHYHSARGNDKMIKCLNLLNRFNIASVAIFYDIIPLRVDGYENQKNMHLEYTGQLFKYDRIISISSFSAIDLKEYSTQFSPSIDISADKIIPLLLPSSFPRIKVDADLARSRAKSRSILLLGTVEPRKLQVDFLEAFNQYISQTKSTLSDIKIHVVGGLHHKVAERLRKAISNNPNIIWHSYLTDSEVEKIKSEVKLSIFCSKYEGFGLPILESLSAGCPVICAGFGSMKEIAIYGGCELVDVNNMEEVVDSLDSLFESEEHYLDLLNSINTEKIPSWNDYGSTVVDILRDTQIKYRPSIRQISELLSFTIEGASNQGRDIAYLPYNLGQQAFSLCSTVQEYCELFEEEKVDSFAIIIYNSDFLQEAIEKAMELNIPHIIIGFDPGSLPNLIQLIKFSGYYDMKFFAEFHVLPNFDSHNLNLWSLPRRLQSKLGAFANQQNEQLYSCFQQNKQYTSLEKSQPLLNIVISTYNRKDFLRKNIQELAWITNYPELTLTIVDNCSTDLSYENCKDLFPDFKGQLTYIKNTANLGILGNLGKISQRDFQGYIWLIGDDDFINPEAIPNILSIIKQPDAPPLLYAHFSVYHREKMTESYSFSDIKNISRPVLMLERESGVSQVKNIATNNDNGFTAIYTNIIKAELLPAIYHGIYRTPFFTDMLHTIPSSLAILDSFSCFKMAWLPGSNIYANAHNSWSSNRPRWHSAIMTELILLANSQGCSNKDLYSWLQTHMELFLDSMNLHVNPDKSIKANSQRDLYPFFLQAGQHIYDFSHDLSFKPFADDLLNQF